MSEAQNEHNERFLPAITLAGASVPFVEGAAAVMHGGVLGGIVALGASGLIYLAADEMAKNGRGIKLPASSAYPSEAEQRKRSEKHGFLYRAINGSQNDEEQPQPKDGRDDPQTEKLPDDVSFDLDGVDDLRPLRGDYFLFSEVLMRFQPTRDKIFLARTDEGDDLFCSARDLCHVALAGVTGGGKSSIMRMLMLQLCCAKLQVLLLNPHYTRCDIEAYGPDGKPCPEDWTPFERYLVYDPMECRKYEVIEHYLKSAAKDIIPRRLERRAKGQPTGKPYFIVIDELPSIVRNVPEAPEYMRVILEEGRKVGVFLISAAQDFLVKSISPNGGGGSIRECYRTAYYVGGDPTTAKVLLDMPANQIPESDLGKGAVMLRSSASKKARRLFVPYVDNEALYKLLGPSTYQAEALVNPESSLNERINAPVNGSASRSDWQERGSDLHLINATVNDLSERERSYSGSTDVNVNEKVDTSGVSAERRETIKRLVEMGALKHAQIAKAVKLDGPKYAIYRQVCAEEGIEIK